MGKNRILLIDMYGVIIKESKGNFIPYTLQHFVADQHDRIWRAIKEEKLFTQAQLGFFTNEEFLRQMGYADPKQTMEDYLKNYLNLDEQFIDFARKYSQVMDFCLLSNDVLEWSDFLTEYHHLNVFFKEKIISGAIQMRKPDAKMFSYTLERLRCKPEDCVFVDNSVMNLQVADQMGISTILFNRDGENYGGMVVNDYAELAKMLDCVLLVNK